MLQKASRYSWAVAGMFSALCLLSSSADATDFSGMQFWPQPPPGIDAALFRIAENYKAGRQAVAAKIALRYEAATSTLGMVVVVVEPVHTPNDIDVGKLRALGCRILDQSRHLLKVEAPIRAIQEIVRVNGVRFVRPPRRPSPLAGVGEGVHLTGASVLHDSGITGLGAKVAVIDVGFEGLSNAIRQGELPLSVQSRDFTGEGMETNGVHGTGVAEIIHDMAPDAELLLLRSSGFTSFENAVEFAIESNAHIINFSAGWNAFGFGDGTGLACEVVDDADDRGVLWVNAAGNEAQKVYSEFYADQDADGWHNIEGQDEVLKLEGVKIGDTVDVILTWNDWPRTTDDYNLALTYTDEQNVVQVVEFANTVQMNTLPVEQVIHIAENNGNYGIAVQKKPQTRARVFKVISESHPLEEHANIVGSLSVPADARGSLSVGAISKVEWLSRFPSPEPFSSQGPTVDGRIKPDIAGPDKTTSLSYTRGFSGTSAASPHVAGAAALIKSADPEYYNAELIRQTLFLGAEDIGDPGKDNVFGWGKLRLDRLDLLQSSPSARITTQLLEFGNIFQGEIASLPITLFNVGRASLEFGSLPPFDPAVVLSLSEPSASALYHFTRESDTIDWRSTAGADWQLDDSRINFQGVAGLLHSLIAPGSFSGDIDVSVDTEWQGGTDTSEFGISFHAGSDSYRLSISGRGGTTLLKRKDGQTQFLTEWETSEAVVAKGRNNLRVVREGSLIVSLINGQPVHQAIDPDFSDGQVRLHVGGEQQVAFDNLRIVEATLSGSTTIEPGESSQFFISYLPDDEGSSTAEAWFATNDTAVSRFKIDLVGNVFLERPSPVAVTNLQRLDFGSLVKVGGRGEQTLRVSNVGRANLEITGYESSSSSLSLIPASGVVEPGGSLAFLVVFSPGVSGPYSGTLTITTNDPVRSHLTIAVEADVAEPEETRIVLVDLQAGEEGNNIPDGTRGLNIRGIGDTSSIRKCNAWDS